MPETYFEVKNLVNKKTFNVSKLSLIADMVKVNTIYKHDFKKPYQTEFIKVTKKVLPVIIRHKRKNK
mgnify:FL=1